MAEGNETPVAVQNQEQPNTQSQDPIQNVLKHLESAGGFGNNAVPQLFFTPSANFEDLKTIQKLKAQGLLPETFPSTPQELDTDEQLVKAGIHLLNKHQVGEILSNKTSVSSPIIVSLPDERALNEYFDTLQQLNNEFWNRTEGKRPTVILYSNFDIPVRYKLAFEGFLYATSPNALKTALDNVRRLKESENSTTFDPKTLEPGQKKSYDESQDLREWEVKTANTYETLKRILQRIALRQNIQKDRYSQLFDIKDGEVSWYTPQDKLSIHTRTVLGIGTGEGRIDGMLARLGLKVIGLDISPEMLKRAKVRIVEEGEGLRGEKEHPGLSYEALKRIQQEDAELRKQGKPGILPLDEDKGEPVQPILNDNEVMRNYLTVEGSFFDAHEVLNTYLANWIKARRINQDIPPEEFFENYNPYSPEQLPADMFEEIGFDMCTITWNTFCEVGDPKNQQELVHKLFNMLVPGGEIFIEIPNRNLEPYKSAVEQFHTSHPDTPYGTVRDPKPDGSGYYPPRYFTDVHELAGWFKALGCEVDIEKDLQSYDVGAEAKADDKQKCNEFVLTVRKPKH